MTIDLRDALLTQTAKDVFNYTRSKVEENFPNESSFIFMLVIFENLVASQLAFLINKGNQRRKKVVKQSSKRIEYKVIKNIK